MTTKPAQSDAPRAEAIAMHEFHGFICKTCGVHWNDVTIHNDKQYPECLPTSTVAAEAWMRENEAILKANGYTLRHNLSLSNILTVYAALRTAQLREQLDSFLNAPSAMMSYKGGLIAINSEGMRTLIDDATAAEAKVAQLERERDAAIESENAWKVLAEGEETKRLAAESALSEARERTIQECAVLLEQAAKRVTQTGPITELARDSLLIAAEEIRRLTSSASAKGE